MSSMDAFKKFKHASKEVSSFSFDIFDGDYGFLDELTFVIYLQFPVIVREKRPPRLLRMVLKIRINMVVRY